MQRPFYKYLLSSIVILRLIIMHAFYCCLEFVYKGLEFALPRVCIKRKYLDSYAK
jgi:hypothetical protein